MAVILPILSTFNASGVKAAQASLGGIAGTLKMLSRQVLGATVGFQALQGAVNFAGDAISSARDLERNMSALGTVFGTLTPEMEAFAKNAYNMGISQSEAAKTATFLGSVLKQAGLPMDQVAQKTKDLTALAQDLATTYGYDTSEALTAMTALFRGEYDPIEKFGVALKQNEVNALVAAKGLGHLTGQELLNAQQTVRMEQLFLRSADAAGAFARQSGTLFVEQKKLTAVFDNMQATVGAQLTPAIAKLMQELTPVVNKLGPSLETTFSSIGGIIESLTPLIQPLGSLFIDLLDAVNLLVGAFEVLMETISPMLLDLFTTLEGLISHIVNGIGELVDLVGDLKTGFDELPSGPVADFLKTVYEWLNLILEKINPVSRLLGSIKALFPGDPATNTASDPSAGRYGAMQAWAAGKKAFDLAQGKGGSDQQKAVKDYVGDFYKSLADEVSKQNARSILANKGFSESFIESIIGSGTGWKKVFIDIKNKSAAARAELQKSFTLSEAGQKEVAALQKKLQDEADARFEKAMDQYNDQLRIYEAQVDAIKALKRSLSEAAQATIPLGVVTREIGQFESATISAFENIAQVIATALADGTILKSAADNLTAYANKEKAVIANLMRQRDEIANKRSLAQAMLTDVKSAIIGVSNITNLINSQAQDITQSVTRMVGNLQVTTTKVIKGIVGGGAKELVASFSDIVTRTKTFAQQLKELRALGLDKNLYQQIVDAGIDAGGQTAKAILEGGAGTVNELNTLFAELDVTGQEIAKNSAEVMFGAGVDLTNGLINGLISQEQALVDTATRLAEAFTTAFNSQISIQVPMPVAPIMPTPENVPIVTVPVVSVPKTTTSTTTTAKSSGNVIINVKASPVNTKATGAAIIAAQKKFFASNAGRLATTQGFTY